MASEAKLQFATMKGFPVLNNSDNKILTIEFLDASREIVSTIGKFLILFMYAQ